MTKLEELENARQEGVKEIERLVKEADECKDEARVAELRAAAEKGLKDVQDINSKIEFENKLQAERDLTLAKEEARKAQAPRQADAKRTMYEPSDADLNGFQVEKRHDVFERVIAGEKVRDEEMVLLHSLTPDEKRFWQEMTRPKNRAQPIAMGASERAVATTQQVGTDADGGFTVPEGFLAEVIISMKDYSPVLQNGVARILNTASGNDLRIPTMNDTANEGALLAEHTDATASKVTVGDITLNAYKYTSGAFAVTGELMQDTGVGFEGILRDAMGIRLGRITSKHFTTGTGSSQPQGVVTGVAAVAARRTVSEADDVVSFDDLIKLISAVDPAYRTGARFMFNSGVEHHLLTKKVGPAQSTNTPDNRLLWGMGVSAGAPNSIYGYPYTINQNMAAHTTANNDAVIFGNFNSFVVRRVRDFRIIRDDSIYVLGDQTAFVGFARYDSRVLNTDAFAVLRIK